MNTREYAVELRKVADFLDSRPDFTIDSGVFFQECKDGIKTNLSYWNKEKFVEAVKAVGPSTKHYTDGEFARLEIIVGDCPNISLTISRDRVCKKIVTFDCEPLFSESEVEAL